jgi:type II secretory pathway component PulF
MPKFEFKAFTREGKLKEGIISAENKDAALKILQEQELLVSYLAEKKTRLIFIFFKNQVLKIFMFSPNNFLIY